MSDNDFDRRKPTETEIRAAHYLRAAQNGEIPEFLYWFNEWGQLLCEDDGLTDNAVWELLLTGMEQAYHRRVRMERE